MFATSDVEPEKQPEPESRQPEPESVTDDEVGKFLSKQMSQGEINSLIQLSKRNAALHPISEAVQMALTNQVQWLKEELLHRPLDFVSEEENQILDYFSEFCRDQAKTANKAETIKKHCQNLKNFFLYLKNLTGNQVTDFVPGGARTVAQCKKEPLLSQIKQKVPEYFASPVDFFNSGSSPNIQADYCAAVIKFCEFIHYRSKSIIVNKFTLPHWNAYDVHVSITLASDIRSISTRKFKGAKDTVQFHGVRNEDKEQVEKCREVLKDIIDGPKLQQLLQKLRDRVKKQDKVKDKELSEYGHIIGYLLTIFNGHRPQTLAKMDNSDWQCVKKADNSSPVHLGGVWSC